MATAEEIKARISELEQELTIAQYSAEWTKVEKLKNQIKKLERKLAGAGAKAAAPEALGALFAEAPGRVAETPAAAPKAAAKAAPAEKKPGLFSRFKGKAKGVGGKAWGGAKKVGAGAATVGGAAVKHRGKIFFVAILMIIIFLVVSLVTFGMALASYIMTPYGLIILAIIGVIILGRKHPRGIITFSILAILGAGIFFFWASTTTGTVAAAKIGTTSGDIFNAQRGISGPINVVKQIMTGTWDPTQLYKSEVQKDMYTSVQNVGVSMENVRPKQETFKAGDEIAIDGALKAFSLPNETTTVTLSAGWATADTGAASNLTWTCKPGSIDRKETWAGRFECTNPGITPFAETEAHTADVSIKYDFNTRGGKVIYVANYYEWETAFVNGEDMLEHFQVTKEEVEAWQSKAPIELALKVLEGDIIGANVEPDNDVWYYLGVSIKNSGSGLLMLENTQDRNPLFITLPKEVTFGGGDFELDTNFNNGNACNDVVCRYRLASTSYLLGERVDPGYYRNYQLKFKVWDTPATGVGLNFLNGSELKALDINADFTYTYKDTQSVSFTVTLK